MPRETSGVTLGFIGTGEIDKDNAAKLLDEHIEARAGDQDPVKFFFIAQTGQWTDTLTEITEMSSRIEIPYEAITKTTDRGKRDLGDITKSAVKVHNVENPIAELQNRLLDSPGPSLLVLYDGVTDEAIDEIVAGFVSAGIPAFDLTDGLTPLEFQKEEPAEEGEEEPEDEGLEDEEEPESAAYTRAELEKLSRDEVKEVAGRMGLAPRRSSMQMIDEILQAQGEGPAAIAGDEDESEVVPPEEPVLADVVSISGPIGLIPVSQYNEEFLKGLQGVLDAFLGEFTRALATFQLQSHTHEIAPKADPEPEEEPEPPRRRRLGEAPATRRIVRSQN